MSNGIVSRVTRVAVVSLAVGLSLAAGGAAGAATRAHPIAQSITCQDSWTSAAGGTWTTATDWSDDVSSSAKEVTLTATLSSTSATGAVAFTAGKTALCSAKIASCGASCTVTVTLKKGTYKVTAAYAGSASYLSAKATMSFKVT